MSALTEDAGATVLMQGQGRQCGAQGVRTSTWRWQRKGQGCRRRGGDAGGKGVWQHRGRGHQCQGEGAGGEGIGVGVGKRGCSSGDGAGQGRAIESEEGKQTPPFAFRFREALAA
jgi:hypothetical protein